MVTCGFCQIDFDEDRGQAACAACPLGSDCGLIRCPECGYENPSTPKWIDSLRNWFGQSSDQGGGSERLPPRTLPMIGTRNPMETAR